MPVLSVSTNVNLEGKDLDAIVSDATRSLSSIIGRPPDKVMVELKGSIEMSFGGSKEAAALVELLSMGGIDKGVKRKLIAAVGTILHTHLSIPPSRVVCNIVDINLNRPRL